MQPEIRILGPAVVRDAGGSVVEAHAWRTHKTFDLLRVLALACGRPVPIDTLLDLFWPHAEPGRGGASLRTATCQIRKVLGNATVVRVGNSLALRGVWVDAAAYRAIASRVEERPDEGRPARVVLAVREAELLYRGDLEVAGTDCVALHDARAELQELRINLLLEAAEAAAACAQWRESLTFAQRAAALETSDRSTRALMRAWFAVGETARPVQEFERLRRHLAEEYGVDPAPQTRALYLEVVSACSEWPPREMTLGRDEEVRRVVSAVTGWMMDPDGPSGVVWLVGEPGSGRQTVAREAARTLMLPLVEESADPGEGATVELLPDQGQLTKGLAAMLHLRAATWRRILIVPVSEVSPQILGESDAVVRIDPLSVRDFRRLMTLTLQGRPTQRLTQELYEEADGLPGLGCALARRRLQEGTLSWTTDGVDSVRRPSFGSRLLPALAAVPMVMMQFLGSEVALEAEKREAIVAEERQRHSTWDGLRLATA